MVLLKIIMGDEMSIRNFITCNSSVSAMICSRQRTATFIRQRISSSSVRALRYPS